MTRPTTWMRHSLAALGLLALGEAAWAQDGGWQFSLTPYLWLPNVNGTLRVSLPPALGDRLDVEAGPNSYLENLSGVLMLAGEARKGPWAVFTDLIYLKFDAEKSKVRSVGSGPVDATLDLGTTSQLEGWSWTLGASHTLVDTPRGTLDAVAGLRYLDVDAAVDWRLGAAVNRPGGAVLPASGRATAGTTQWDGIVGVRGGLKLGEGKWSLPYYLDVGAGSSDLTWQALAGIAYRFSWGELKLVYRHLAYDQGADKTMRDFSFSGPALGATFRF
ncbi:MAG: hypothetical protein JNL87_15085 [Burkholderiaceae bacterium]|nr:hypothetical protein [Burkholderiaceae bacterium]